MPSLLSDQPGLHNIVGFHDGYLSGFRASRRGDVNIWCWTRAEDEYLITIPGPGMLRVSSFTGANIINVINIYDAPHCPRRLYAEISGLGEEQFKPVLDSRFQQFKTNNGKLVEIATSDGCLFLATFEGAVNSIQIIRADDRS